jgi:hypothetical protein
MDNRFEFRLAVPASDPDRALHALIETLEKILAKIWEADPHVRILTWLSNSSANPLKSIMDIPTSVSLLRQFFPCLIPISKGGTHFTSIYIRSSISPGTLKENVDWYLYDNKHGLYLAQIQSEMVDTILWFLWSSELTNTGTLRQATEWPLHLCMRAVPLLKDVLNGLIKKDIHRLIGRQASFNDEEFGKRKINTWEIKELDFESATSGKTLRDFILAILRQDNPSRKLFHSVDNLCTNRSTVVFTCMPAVESEACNMVSSLLTYLKQQHGDQVLELFTKNAQISAIDSYWDEKAQCVRNKDDAHVAGLLNDIDDDYILPPIHKDNQPSQNMPAPVRPQPITRHTPSSAIPLMMTMIQLAPSVTTEAPETPILWLAMTRPLAPSPLSPPVLQSSKIFLKLTT